MLELTQSPWLQLQLALNDEAGSIHNPVTELLVLFIFNSSGFD